MNREHGYMQLGVVGEKLRIIQDGHDVTQNFMGLPVAVKVTQNKAERIVSIGADFASKPLVTPEKEDKGIADAALVAIPEEEPDEINKQMAEKKPVKAKKKVSNE